MLLVMLHQQGLTMSCVTQVVEGKGPARVHLTEDLFRKSSTPLSLVTSPRRMGAEAVDLLRY